MTGRRPEWADHRSGIAWHALVESLADDELTVKLARDLDLGSRWLWFDAAPHWRLIRVGSDQLILSRRVWEFLESAGVLTLYRGGTIAWLHAPAGVELAGQPDGVVS